VRRSVTSTRSNELVWTVVPVMFSTKTAAIILALGLNAVWFCDRSYCRLEVEPIDRFAEKSVIRALLAPVWPGVVTRTLDLFPALYDVLTQGPSPFSNDGLPILPPSPVQEVGASGPFPSKWPRGFLSGARWSTLFRAARSTPELAIGTRRRTSSETHRILIFFISIALNFLVSTTLIIVYHQLAVETNLTA